MTKEKWKTSGAGDLCFVNEKGRSEMCTMKRERGREKDGVYRGEKEEREERGEGRAAQRHEKMERIEGRWN